MLVTLRVNIYVMLGKCYIWNSCTSNHGVKREVGLRGETLRGLGSGKTVCSIIYSKEVRQVKEVLLDKKHIRCSSNHIPKDCPYIMPPHLESSGSSLEQN